MEIAVAVDGLHRSYGDVVAVDDVSFTVGTGEVFGILGPNGSGKSTTVEMIAGLRRGDRGSVRVLGLDPWTERDAVTRILSIQLQSSRLQAKITVREALELWSAFYDDPVPWRGLAERLDLADRLDHRFAHLSGGQQQRLSIALALVGRPRVAILDELSTGLDPQARRDVWEIVRDLRSDGVTVLLVTHAMEEAQALCDRIAVLADGRVRAVDTPDGLIRTTVATSTMSFEAPGSLEPALLRDLPEVTSVHVDHGRIHVHGRESAAVEVILALEAQGLRPRGLQVASGSLEDAYLGLTTDLPESVA